MSAREGIGQAVVLCGGRGLRLERVLGETPKALAPIAGEPLLGHLLEGLGRSGAEEVLLVAGHRAEPLAQALPSITPRGLRVELVVEEEPRGTAGALLQIEQKLRERFLLIYGDLFTDLDFRTFARAAGARGGLGTLLVHRSSHPEDSDVLAVDDAQRVIAWLPRSPARPPGAVVSPAALTNSAVGAFHRSLLDYIPRDRACDLYGEVLPALIDARASVHGYLSSEYVRDIGTPERLSAVDADVRAGRTRRRADLALLDRDGVLSPEAPPLVDRRERLSLLPGAAAGVRALNQAGLRVAVVTNQAIVARGLCTPSGLEEIHHRLRELLAREGATLDAIYACPHHPETHHPGGVAALRGPCRCRKPATGMVADALRDLAVPAWRALVVGDSSVDMQLAHNAGLPAAALATGQGGRDGRHPARPSWRFADLEHAAAWIAGGEASEPDVT